MKLYEAIQQGLASVTTMLIGAGLVEGKMLDPAQIKTETHVLFWEMIVPGGDASQKQLYVTYSIESANADDQYYLDGVSSGYEVIVAVDIFSRANDVATLVNAIETQVEEADWEFLFGSKNYDATNKAYAYRFLVKGTVS